MPEEDRDAELELIALAIADTTAGLRFEDRGVYAATPLIPRRSVRRQRGADGETSLCHCYEQGTDRRARPSVDAIREFEMLTSTYDASFGRNPGAQVNVILNSGTNDFHGSLFEFFRNTSLDARSFFAISPEKFNLNQFGGSLGGPIRKNKTFFFVDTEALRYALPSSGVVSIPTVELENYALAG